MGHDLALSDVAVVIKNSPDGVAEVSTDFRGNLLSPAAPASSTKPAQEPGRPMASSAQASSGVSGSRIVQGGESRINSAGPGVNSDLQNLDSDDAIEGMIFEQDSPWDFISGRELVELLHSSGMLIAASVTKPGSLVNASPASGSGAVDDATRRLVDVARHMVMGTAHLHPSLGTDMVVKASSVVSAFKGFGLVRSLRDETTREMVIRMNSGFQDREEFVKYLAQIGI
jgi:hypothetical protein